MELIPIIWQTHEPIETNAEILFGRIKSACILPDLMTNHLNMRSLYLTLWLILLTATGFSLRVTDLYKAGDHFEYSIESGGKVIGTQAGTCNGWKIEGADSLLTFSMETKSVFSRAGKTFDMTITSEAAYRPDGLPRKYNYMLNLLNVKVEHTGEFGGTEYFGKSVRMGVEQPFSYHAAHWPVLFDNNFVLQWEFAIRPLHFKAVGDSAATEAMIPQLNQMVVLKFRGLPDEHLMFDGKDTPVKVYKVEPANQALYVDQTGRLLKAVDTAQKITITRLAQGQRVEVARKSFFATTRDRLHIYGLLFAFAAAWFFIFGYKQKPQIDTFAIFVIGCAFYWLSLQLLIPVQNTYFGLLLDPKSPSSNFSVVLLGSALLFAIVEELAKFIPLFVRSLTPPHRQVKSFMALGAACGVGFGLMQAANLTGFAPDGSILDRADLAQKFLLIGINGCSGALIGLLMSLRLVAAFYLIPVGIKTLFDWLEVFVQKGIVGSGLHVFTSAVFAASLLAIIYLIFLRFADRQRISERKRNQ